MDLVAIVRIDFLDHPPPFLIDLDAFSNLKRDVLSVCGDIIERENKEKRQKKRFAEPPGLDEQYGEFDRLFPHYIMGSLRDQTMNKEQ